MTTRFALVRLLMQEDLNFLLTNRIPRRLVTHLVGWLSRIEQPLVRRLSMWVWRSCTDLDLSEARHRAFRSVHDCFTRQLKDGARPVDSSPDVLISPCDAIVGAMGKIQGTTLFQAKGFPYTLSDLLHDPALERHYRDGRYVTLRLTSAMYHRFHAPHDCRVQDVTYISGDTWNVNPIALQRVERLFCRNERCVIPLVLDGGSHLVTLVPIAAILVASIRLNCLDVVLGLRHKGPNLMRCEAQFAKGQEMGRFELGSTILLFAPGDFEPSPGVEQGRRIRMGEPLLRLA